MGRSLLILAILFSLRPGLFGQTNPPDCPPNGNTLTLSQTCNQACVVCGSIDGYTGQTLMNGQGQGFPEFCTQVVHSIKYVAFVAGSQDLTLEVSIGPCTIGNSIEMGIFETLDCQSFESVSDCNTAMFNGNTYAISNTEPLEPGCHYYLVIDNNGPASCQFSIDVVNGSTGAQTPAAPAVPDGPTKLCPGASATYTIPPVPFACGYQWTLPPGATIDGQSGTVTLPHATGTSVTVQFGNTGGQICVRGINVCQNGPATCLPVMITPIPPTVLPKQVICQGDTYEWLDGDQYNTTQLLTYTYQTPIGCDSTVNQQLVVKPPVIKNIGSISFCQGSCIDTMGVQACATGLYEAHLQTYLGCDSIVQFLAVMVPAAAAIALPDTLGCMLDSAILAGSGPTGPTITWEWFSPQGMFISNDDSIKVGKPGLYKLVVTNIKQGFVCRDTAFATVVRDTLSPSVTLTGDTLNCTSKTGQISVTVSPPAALLSWSGPNNFTSGLPAPFVQIPGTYYLSAENVTNNCITTDSVIVAGDTLPPDIAVQGGILTCTQPVTLLSGSSNTPGIAFYWTGPGTFNSTLPNPPTNTPGIYTLTATAPNGCMASDTAVVTAMQNPPTVIAGGGGELNCLQPALALFAVTDDPNLIFLWSGSQGFSSNQQNPVVDQPGVYILLSAALNGCTDNDTVFVTANFAVPIVAASGGVLSCSQPVITLIGNSPDSGIQWLWSDTQGFVSNMQNPPVSLPGIYTLIVTALNGCTASDTAIVEQSADFPVLMAAGDTLTCIAPGGQLSANSSTPGLVWAWTGPGGFSSGQQNPAVQSPGQYTLIATSPANGCTASAQVVVLQDNTPPQIAAAGDTLTCASPAGQVSANSATPGLVWAWTGPGGFSSSQQNPAVQSPGQYTLIATSPANGCTVMIAVEVTDNRQFPIVFQAVDSLPLTCLNDTVLVEIQLQTTADISWLTPLGMAGSSTTLLAFVAGNYIWTATGPTGCSVSDTIRIIDHIRPIFGADIDLQLPACFGDASALVAIDAVDGGMEPYLFSFDNQLFGNNNHWENISAGEHAIRIREAGGCEWDTVLTITEPVDWSIWLPPDTTVFRGEQLLIQAQTDLPLGQLKQVKWQPPMSCDTCLYRSVKMFFDQWFVATATDLSGCVHADSMFIRVKQKRNIFIPNIFSPNDDGINDLFQIYADDDLERIDLFRIYDRWGELVYEEKDAVPGAGQGWDGRFRKQKAASGVYAWVTVLVFKGGAKEQYAGDVTLLR